MAFLQAQGNIEPEEMARTFNCGIGMAVVVAEGDVADVTAALEAAGETVFRIGHIAEGAKGCTVSGGAGTWSAMAAWSATQDAEDPPRKGAGDHPQDRSEDRRVGKAGVGTGRHGGGR